MWPDLRKSTTSRIMAKSSYYRRIRSQASGNTLKIFEGDQTYPCGDIQQSIRCFR